MAMTGTAPRRRGRTDDQTARGGADGDGDGDGAVAAVEEAMEDVTVEAAPAAWV